MNFHSQKLSSEAQLYIGHMKAARLFLPAEKKFIVPFGPSQRGDCGVPMSPVTIQEAFFGAALERGKHVTVYLLNGAKVTGRVRSFDKYSVILSSEDAEQLVFKHSISSAFLCRDKQCPQCVPMKSASVDRPAALAS
jgi:RNA chaperone Hfq